MLTKKIVTLDNLEYFHEKLQNEKGVFIGTQEDYDAANSAGKIKTGSLVIILDSSELEESTVTASLGGMKVEGEAVYAKDFVAGEHKLSEKVDKTYIDDLELDELNAILVDTEEVADDPIVSEYITKNELNVILKDKQDKLVSGTNIKTINGESILGEGDIVIEEGETLYTPITWAELRDLRDNKGLTTGMWYRITDYVTTISLEGTRSAGHPFDILVLATSEDTLSEEAKAVRRKVDTVTTVTLMGFTFYYKGSIVIDGVEWFEFEHKDPGMGSALSSSAMPNVGDVVYACYDGEINTEEYYPIESVGEAENEYFLNIGENLNAWKVWYCLDNDRKRFPWAVTKTTKSISVLLDEDLGNTTPINAEYVGTYVYEDVLYHKWDGIFYGTSFSLLTYKEDVQEGDIVPYMFIEEGNVVGLGETISSVLDGSDNEGFGVIYRLIDGNNNDVAYDFKNIQFVRKLTNGKIDLESGTEEYVFTFDLYTLLSSHVDHSSNFTCRSNIIRSSYVPNNIVFLNRSDADYCHNNTFGDSCGNNTFGDNCYNNTFGDDCYNNTFGDDCSYNTFGEWCSENTFGYNFNFNNFGYSCESNIFGDNCNNNTFGDNCNNNTFGDSCNNNTFGDSCKSNIFGDNCDSNTFGNDCESNTFDTLVKNYKISSDIQNVHIDAESNNRDYETTVAYNSKGELKSYCGADIEIGSGSGGECVADKVVRTLYGAYGELTNEQKAYNAETYQMFFSESTPPPLIMFGHFNVEYSTYTLPSSGEPVSLTMKNIVREMEPGVILLQNITLNSDGSVVVVGSTPTVVPINCNLNEPEYARIYCTIGKDIKECNPCILGENGMRYFIDASHASNSESLGYVMEYNTFEKRYRIFIDPSTYAITETEEIPFGGSGGGSGNYLEIRELKMNDDMTVTEAHKAYNIETYNKAQAGETFALSVMGFVLDMGTVLSEPVESVLFSFVTPNPFEEGILSLNVALFPDGTFNIRELDYGTVDTAMSDSSENAVQNKVVKKYIDDALAAAITTTLNTAV